MQRLRQELRFHARRLMKQSMFILIATLTLALSMGFTQVKTTTIPLDSSSEMQLRNVKTEQVTYSRATANGNRGRAKPPSLLKGTSLK
jgi:hypothetical protein